MWRYAKVVLIGIIKTQKKDRNYNSTGAKHTLTKKQKNNHSTFA